MNEYSKGDVNEVKPIKGTLKGNQGVGKLEWCFRWKILQSKCHFLMTKTDFLRQLRLPAANTRLRKQKKMGGAIILRWRHGKMKGAFSWNPGCSTTSIFIMMSHPLWCGLRCALWCVCVYVCVSGLGEADGVTTNSLRVREWSSQTEYDEWV